MMGGKPWGIDSFRDWLVEGGEEEEEEKEESAKEITRRENRKVENQESGSGNAGEESILSKR